MLNQVGGLLGLAANPDVVESVIGSGMRGSTFSVMLPQKPDSSGQYRKAEFLTAGGIPTAVVATNPGTYLATASSRIDSVTVGSDGRLSSVSRLTGPLAHARWYTSGVLLPTGEVFAVSGADRDEVATPGLGFAVRQAEIFDPQTETWRGVALQNNPRTYHNTAVLLRDGRVLVGGHAPITTAYLSNIDLSSLGFSPNDGRDPSFEIYSPPYMFRTAADDHERAGVGDARHDDPHQHAQRVEHRVGGADAAHGHHAPRRRRSARGGAPDRRPAHGLDRRGDPRVGRGGAERAVSAVRDEPRVGRHARALRGRGDPGRGRRRELRTVVSRAPHGGATMKAEECILFSGAANGAEAAFGAAAQRHGVAEVNFTFEGHNDARTRGIRVLTEPELKQGDVSLSYVSRLMHREFRDTRLFRRVLQSIWHQVNNGLEVFVVGRILDDGTVKGGTGWGAEFAKLCNKPLFVFDQVRGHWSRWTGDEWEKCASAHDHAAALHGNRHALPRAGRRARDRRAVRALVPVGGQTSTARIA